ncbi:hypothetical protein Rumeso_04918 [Rubellimicrobium mesophilum DSM 19309]|uniref:Uncharacterized protein n=1 Tax=Rubellimicrobium mesophilum DSM 19309 TaxID=442562 RepID=A0A017HAL1_9RHOB|nr:hypothetical protein Rumeso_04918 [Rubellimicrobium mesophilum DSM 19309]
MGITYMGMSRAHYEGVALTTSTCSGLGFLHPDGMLVRTGTERLST